MIRKIFFTFLFGVFLVALATWFLKDLPESNSWFTLDTVFHFVGGMFAAWCACLIAKDKRVVFVLAVLIGLGWELAEYLSLIYGPIYWPVIYPYYHGGGLIDTLHDLVADVFGIIIFILLYYRYVCIEKT